MARTILMTQNQELEKPAAQPPGAEPNNTEKPKAGMIFVEQSFAWREEAFVPTASDEGGAPSSNRQSLQDKVKNYSACPEKTMNAKFLKEALKYLYTQRVYRETKQRLKPSYFQRTAKVKSGGT